MIKIRGCKKESQFAKVTLLVKKYHVDRCRCGVNDNGIKVIKAIRLCLVFVIVW